MSKVLALVAVLLLAANAGFQIALASGMKWGHHAFGGRAAREDGSLPPRYRVMGLVSAIVMGLLGWVALAAGGNLGEVRAIDDGFLVWVCAGVAVLFALNTAGNLASSSRIERWVMGPATACLAVVFGLLGWLLRGDG